jgi:hypothetical protein
VRITAPFSRWTGIFVSRRSAMALIHSAVSRIAIFPYGQGTEITKEKEMAPVSTSQPNIVFFLWDNLGWGEVGCYGRDDKDPSKVVRET